MPKKLLLARKSLGMRRGATTRSASGAVAERVVASGSTGKNITTGKGL